MLRDRHNDLLHLLTMLESLEKILVFSLEAEDAESFFRLNELLNELYANTQKRIANGIFDKGELKAAMESDYYGKVQFSRLENK